MANDAAADAGETLASSVDGLTVSSQPLFADDDQPTDPPLYPLNGLEEPSNGIGGDGEKQAQAFESDLLGSLDGDTLQL